MKTGAHDVAELRQGCIRAFGDMALLCGMGGDERARCEKLIDIAVASVAGRITDHSPAVTVAVPASFQCVDPVACGGAHLDGLYSAAVFEVTGGIYHAGKAHRYAFSCSRNSRLRNNRKSSTNGAVYLHSAGRKQRMFLFDDAGNLTVYPGRQGK